MNIQEMFAALYNQRTKGNALTKQPKFARASQINPHGNAFLRSLPALLANASS